MSENTRDLFLLLAILKGNIINGPRWNLLSSFLEANICPKFKHTRCIFKKRQEALGTRLEVYLELSFMLVSKMAETKKNKKFMRPPFKREKIMQAQKIKIILQLV